MSTRTGAEAGVWARSWVVEQLSGAGGVPSAAPGARLRVLRFLACHAFFSVDGRAASAQVLAVRRAKPCLDRLAGCLLRDLAEKRGLPRFPRDPCPTVTVLLKRQWPTEADSQCPAQSVERQGQLLIWAADRAMCTHAERHR